MSDLTSDIRLGLSVQTSQSVQSQCRIEPGPSRLNIQELPFQSAQMGQDIETHQPGKMINSSKTEWNTTALSGVVCCPWYQQQAPNGSARKWFQTQKKSTQDPLFILFILIQIKLHSYPKGKPWTQSVYRGYRTKPQHAFPPTLSFIKKFHFLKEETTWISIWKLYEEIQASQKAFSNKSWWFLASI